ncbi:hypothetical protein [Curtobacterium luteum]|nr:hypothetical protein [Curtobacterium luteum]
MTIYPGDPRDVYRRRRGLVNGINRMNNTSPALFEAGLSTLTLDEHDTRNGFNAIAQLPEFQLLD